jgi:hypothetical protein
MNGGNQMHSQEDSACSIIVREIKKLRYAVAKLIEMKQDIPPRLTFCTVKIEAFEMIGQTARIPSFDRISLVLSNPREMQTKEKVELTLSRR